MDSKKAGRGDPEATAYSNLNSLDSITETEVSQRWVILAQITIAGNSEIIMERYTPVDNDSCMIYPQQTGMTLLTPPEEQGRKQVVFLSLKKFILQIVAQSEFFKDLKITHCLTNVWSDSLYNVF